MDVTELNDGFFGIELLTKLRTRPRSVDANSKPVRIDSSKFRPTYDKVQLNGPIGEKCERNIPQCILANLSGTNDGRSFALLGDLQNNIYLMKIVP